MRKQGSGTVRRTDGRNRDRYGLSRILMVSTSLALAGCSSTPVVTSAKIDQGGLSPGAVGIYGVGRSWVQVTLSLPDDAVSADADKKADEGTAKDAAGDKKSAGAAPKKAAVATADAPAAVDKSQAANASATPKAGDAQDGQATVAQPASCKDLRTEYRKSRITYMRFKATTDGLLTQIDGLTDPEREKNPATDAEIKAVVTGLQQYLKDSPAAIQVAHVANKTYALIQDECPTPVAVNLKYTVDADPDQLFQLKPDVDNSSTDSFTFKTDEVGLPLLVETSADDQTGAVLTGLATSIGTVVGAVKAPAGQPLDVGSPGWKHFSFQSHKDLQIFLSVFDKKSVSDLTSQLEKAKPDQRLPLLLAIAEYIILALPNTPQPIDPKIPPAPQNYEILKLGKDNNITENIAISATCGQELFRSDNTSYSGVVVSLPRPCTIDVTMGKQSLAHASVLALDSRSLYVVPVERTSLVKQTTHIDFTNGRVTNAQYVRPSPVVAAVSLPSNIVGGFLGGIVGGITGQKDSVTAETDLINAKANLLTAQATYKQAVTDANNSSTGN
ncbi:MAG: hypothetical protein PW843_27180 [Azospirillaceae bacterium]|nr:hypothetical protein [Azospirillaceae bacterium]